MKKFIMLLACLVAIATSTHAQRLIPGQRALQLSVGVPISESKLFGKGDFTVEMAITINHKRANYWLFGLEYSKKNYDYRDIKIPSETFAFEGGYILNLFSDASKTLFFNTGVTAVAGYETVNRNEKLLFDGATLVENDNFVYGAAYHLALDIFATNNVVLFMKGKCNVFWGSDMDIFRTQIGTGIRIIF